MLQCQHLVLGLYPFLLASQDLILCTMDEGERGYAHLVMYCRINSCLDMVPLKTSFLRTIRYKDKWAHMLVQGETTTCQMINITRLWFSMLLDADRSIILIISTFSNISSCIYFLCVVSLSKPQSRSSIHGKRAEWSCCVCRTARTLGSNSSCESLIVCSGICFSCFSSRKSQNSVYNFFMQSHCIFNQNSGVDE